MEQFNQKKNINPTEVRTWVIEQRKSKSTYWAPSDKNSMTCGSFFTNPIVERNILIAIQEKGYQPVFWEIDDLHVKISGGWLIENAGFTKGYQFRSVRISEKSALSIANWDGGSATDIKDLADQIEQKVFEKFSVKLKREVIYL
jgi:UDP-N-acetylmuramate dehydrogenase